LDSALKREDEEQTVKTVRKNALRVYTPLKRGVNERALTRRIKSTIKKGIKSEIKQQIENKMRELHMGGKIGQ
jgi:hypothetical protein